MTILNRRNLILGCAAVAVVGPGRPGSAAQRLLTPAATEGPFYPDRLPLHTDNDLVAIAPGGQQAEGEVFHLSGRLTDAAGAPKPGFRIEIWQCDANGIYQHSGDSGRGTFDPNFQGFGFTTSSPAGAYRFRTITPVSYPGRTPHIHFKVKAPNRREFTSQLYLEGNPRNNGDFLFNRIGSAAAQKAASVRQVSAPEFEGGAVKGTFDIVLR